MTCYHLKSKQAVDIEGTLLILGSLESFEFEETFIRPLADAQANSMLQQGMNNMLVHSAPDSQHGRALDLQRYVLVPASTIIVRTAWAHCDLHAILAISRTSTSLSRQSHSETAIGNSQSLEYQASTFSITASLGSKSCAMLTLACVTLN